MKMEPQEPPTSGDLEGHGRLLPSSRRLSPEIELQSVSLKTQVPPKVTEVPRKESGRINCKAPNHRQAALLPENAFPSLCSLIVASYLFVGA
jgi:hypothetical protein